MPAALKTSVIMASSPTSEGVADMCVSGGSMHGHWYFFKEPSALHGNDVSGIRPGGAFWGVASVRILKAFVLGMHSSLEAPRLRGPSHLEKCSNALFLRAIKVAHALPYRCFALCREHAAAAEEERRCAQEAAVMQSSGEALCIAKISELRTGGHLQGLGCNTPVIIFVHIYLDDFVQ